MRIRCERNDLFWFTEVLKSNTFLKRMRGLLGYRDLRTGQGMLLYPCRGIHCYGMRFSIDAIFLNQKKEVVFLAPGLVPGDLVIKKKAYYVLEAVAGSIESSQIIVGDKLIFTEEEG